MYGYVSNYTGIFMHFQGRGVKFLGEGDLYSCGGCLWNIHIYESPANVRPANVRQSHF